MDKVEILKVKIKKAFKDVEFPHHCGIRAAIAMDDWISDPSTLREITSTKDIKAQWWEIPGEEFNLISLAFCYFDSVNTEFYLPAYMVYVLENLSYANCNCLITWLTPRENDEECAFYDMFLENFSKIKASKKSACIEIIKYINENLPANDCNLINDIQKLLESEFWKESADIKS